MLFRNLPVSTSMAITLMKKKVLIIVENLPVPFDRRVWKEACALNDEGYQVTVLCPRAKGHMERHVVAEGIDIYRHPMTMEANGPLGYVWEYGCALFWEIAYAWWIYIKSGFDIIQGCNPPDNIVLVALPFKLLGVKYVFDHHDASPELYLAKYEKKGFVYLLLHVLEKLTYYCSDAVIATNESYKELAVTRGRVDPRDVFVVRNGPDLTSFRPVCPRARLKYGKRYLVGYVGTMSHQEGLDILIDVVQEIKAQRRRDVHFTCIGGGPALADLCQLVKDRELDDIINFTGRVPDQELLEVLSTADVCVNPDKPCRMNDISTMIKIMEYMALGKPIVQFDLKEGRFTAQDASLYSNAQNPVTEFAKNILWLLDHPEERKRMGEFGSKRVKENLDWKYSVANLLLAYQHACNHLAQRRPIDNLATETKSGPSRARDNRSIGAK
jgi:glycosyltransferase involved in cell wall biosynthesis